MDRRKAIDIAVSVIAAVILWVYVINIVNPQTTGTLKQVPVRITGADQLEASGLAISYIEEDYIDLDISGARNEVRSVSGTDVQAFVDASRLVLGENQAVVSVKLPGGISLDERDPIVINVVTEEFVTQPKPVTAVLTGAGAGQEEALVKDSLSQVTVSGAKSRVEKVSSVSVEADISSYGLDVLADLTLAVKAVDAEGKEVLGVSTSPSEISVTAALYRTKTLPISVSLTGSVWEGASVLESSVPGEITIKGPVELLSKISSVEAKPVDISGIYESCRFDVVPDLPKGVFPAKASSELYAEITVSESGTLSFEYSASDVIAADLEPGYTAHISTGASDIKAIVSGPVSVLRTLAAGDVAPQADMSGRGAGDFFVQLKPSREIEGLTVEYTPATISIRVKTD